LIVENYSQEVGETNTLLVPQPKSWGSSLPGPYGCCAYALSHHGRQGKLLLIYYYQRFYGAVNTNITVNGKISDWHMPSEVFFVIITILNSYEPTHIICIKQVID